MKKTYYSPAMEETIWQSLNAICEGSSPDEYVPETPDGKAPRRL